MSALRKVLVVDDDAVVGKSFNRVLSKKGYVVTSVHNAHEALKQVREQSFDVVSTSSCSRRFFSASSSSCLVAAGRVARASPRAIPPNWVSSPWLIRSLPCSARAWAIS